MGSTGSLGWSLAPLRALVQGSGHGPDLVERLPGIADDGSFVTMRAHAGSLLPGTLALAAYALWQVVRVLAMDFAVRTANLGLLQIVAPDLPVLLTGAILAVGVGLYWMRPAWRETGRGVRWLFAGLGLVLLLRAAVIAFQTG